MSNLKDKYMYCVYCGEDHDPTTEFTDEHIVPYALGGSDELTIQVCTSSNNSLGGLVDKPFIEIFPVRAQRFFLGLRGTDGTEPTIDLGGKSLVNGKEVHVKYTITKDGKELRIARPTVTKTPGCGWDYWSVSGDPRQVREIIEGKLKALKDQGKQMKTATGELIELQNLDELLSNANRQQVGPGILKTVTIDPSACTSFFAKLALSVGHHVLGEQFSRSAGASILRRAIHGRDDELSTTLRARIWPYVDEVESLLVLFRKERAHVLGVVKGEPPVFFASLFGTYEAFVPLGPLDANKMPQTSNDGRVIEVELPSRAVRDRTLVDYLAALLSARRVS